MLYKRFKARVPRFFRRLQWFAGSLATLCASLQELPHVPEKVAAVAATVGWMAGAAVLVAQFACENPPEK